MRGVQNLRLLPDILVCTAIGSEGIDLHLNCDEIIHHDLPWRSGALLSSEPVASIGSAP